MKSSIERVFKEINTITLDDEDVKRAIINYVKSSMKTSTGDVEVTFGRTLGNTYAAKVIISRTLESP